MKPTRMKNFKVNRASGTEAEWLRNTLNREGKRFGTGVELDDEGILVLLWQ
jgi:poly-gamma-glutamate synthesis protein (capsule biosynthesis protein)